MIYINELISNYFEHLSNFGQLIELYAVLPPSSTIEDINLDEGTIIVATIVVATSFAINYGLRKRKLRADCIHEWKDLRSTTQILVFTCSMCTSGPHWMIWQCIKCGLKRCQTCKTKP